MPGPEVLETTGCDPYGWCALLADACECRIRNRHAALALAEPVHSLAVARSRESFQPRLVLQQVPQTLPCSAVPRSCRHATLALANKVLPRDALELRRCC